LTGDFICAGVLRYNYFVSENQSIELLRLLAARLERLSADSHWARRSSGVRGNILKVIEQVDAGESVDNSRLDLLIGSAFGILLQAAEDIAFLESWYKKAK
jgi:hypothetical protein